MRARPTFDCARALAARLALASALLGAQRTNADGAVELQPVVSLVRGLNMDDRVWDATTFSKNRDRLLRGEIAAEFFAAVLALARGQELLSDEHFTVDGTLVEGWAILKSFQPKTKRGDQDKPDDPGNPTVNFHGQKRSNETHQSTTDSDLRLFKKTKVSEAKLVYQGHVLMKNRNGLVVNAQLTQASGTTEREAALALLGQSRKRVTLAADKAYDTKEFVADLRERRVTPHVAQNDKRRGVVPTIAARPVILTMPLVNRNANESKRSSAG